MKTITAYVQIILLIATSVCYAGNKAPTDQEMSLDYYLSMDNAKRSYSDIAIVNLLCSQGLPGAEDLDMEKSLATLKEWARFASMETKRLFPLFRKKPHEYNYSEGYFRTLVLVTVLSRNFGIKYNSDLISTPSMEDLKSTAFFRNAENVFLLGLITKRLGTCSSIPVLTVAVGRMMGYPLRLVNAKAHLFARWQGKAEVFNIENTGHGLICHSDVHYMKWPFEISKAEIETGFFLRSLNPTEELATFLETRAFCLLENNRTNDALTAFRVAYSLYPNHPYLKGYIDGITIK
jgi:hypothetical protein